MAVLRERRPLEERRTAGLWGKRKQRKQNDVSVAVVAEEERMRNGTQNEEWDEKNESRNKL